MSEEQQEGDQTKEPDDQTAKQFSQEDVNRFMAKDNREIKEQLGDYQNVKDELDSLKSADKKRREAEMSELEKANSAFEDMKSNMSTLENENAQYKMKDIKDKVLNADVKFNDMPPIYRNSIALSDDEISVAQSAEEVYKKYRQDFRLDEKETIPPPNKDKVNLKPPVSGQPNPYAALYEDQKERAQRGWQKR
jgi:hypothetical protein